MRTAVRRGRNRSKKQENGFISVFLGMIVIGLAGYAFLNSPFFKVSKVEVIGAVTYSSEEILMLSGINTNDNILKIRPKAIASRLADKPKIKSVTVRRILPSTLQITLKEREAIALFPYSTYFLEIDREGVPITIVEDISKSRLPLITGIRASGVKLGRPISNKEFLSILRVPASLSKSARNSLSEIHAESTDDIVIYSTNGVKIHWGEAKVNSRKANIFDEIMASLPNKELKTAYIDISVPESPVIAGGELKVR